MVYYVHPRNDYPIMRAIRVYITLLLLAFQSQTWGQLYTFDIQDPSTYSITCGTITGAYWGVKNNRCELTTTATYINSGCFAGDSVTVPLKLVINQSGQLSCQDSAYICYSYDNVNWLPLDTIIGCNQTANLPYFYYPVIPNNSNFRFRVFFENSAPNDWWQVKDGDIVINDPCILLSLDVDPIISGTAAAAGNLITVDNLSDFSEGTTFLLERSTDGEHFARVGQAMWDGDAASTIEVLDPQPGRTSYYKVTAINTDGDRAFSDIIAVDRDMWSEATFTMSPNPATQIVNLQVSGEECVNYRLIDMSGQVIQSGRMTGKGQLDVSAVRPGVYFVLIEGAQQTWKEKLVVLH